MSMSPANVVSMMTRASGDLVRIAIIDPAQVRDSDVHQSHAVPLFALHPTASTPLDARSRRGQRRAAREWLSGNPMKVFA